MIPLFLPFSHLTAVYGIYSESGKPLQIKDLLTTAYRGLLGLCKFKSRLAHQTKRHAAACLLVWVAFVNDTAKSRTPSGVSCFLLFFRAYKMIKQAPVSVRQPGVITTLKWAVIWPESSALHIRSVRRILDSDGSKSAARPVICTLSSKNLPLFSP